MRWSIASPALCERAHRGEHSPVCGSVEVVVLEADVEGGVEMAFVQENGAEH